MHPVYRLSGLGRAVDFGTPTNVAIAGIAGVVLLARTGERIAHGTPLAEAATQGLWISIATFLAWAVIRELAPDAPIIAFAGAAFAIASSLRC